VGLDQAKMSPTRSLLWPGSGASTVAIGVAEH